MEGEDDTLHNEPNGGDWYQCSAEHSHPVNSNMKAYAAWYMFARLAGWEGPDTTGLVKVTSIDIKAEGGSTEINTAQGTLQMTANVSPDDASDTTITWSVTNGTGQATISPGGLLTAVANGTVTVMASANDGSGIKASIQITITNQTTGISSYKKSADTRKIKVFPNPSSDFIQVGGEMEFPSAVGIYNMTGRLIREERLESWDQPIDISGLPEGLYIVRMRWGDDNRTASFIKK
jgi:hypothetical protein